MEKALEKRIILNGLLGTIGDTRNFRMQAYSVANYIATECKNVLGENSKEKILIAVMRAGNAFTFSFITHMPNAEIHFIAAKRNGTTFESKILWSTLKDRAPRNTDVILLEPMLATGGTMDKIIDLVNEILVPRSVIIASAFSSKVAEDKIGDKADIITFMGGLELNDEKYILIPDPQNSGSHVTLDFGDEFCGTIQ